MVLLQGYEYRSSVFLLRALHVMILFLLSLDFVFKNVNHKFARLLTRQSKMYINISFQNVITYILF